MITREEITEFDRVYNYMDGEMVLGYLEIRVLDGVIDIINVFTNENMRNKGIATSLFKYMFEHEKHDRIMLEVNEKNTVAINLYNKLGFKEISMRDRYYNEDTALIMERVNK